MYRHLTEDGSAVKEKPGTKTWKRQAKEQNADPVMRIIPDRDEKNPFKGKTEGDNGVCSMEVVVGKAQERFSRALQRRYQYESNLNPAQEFLLHHVNSKIPLVIMYADLVGSTKMSMTLPVYKMVTVIRGFSYEMSSMVHSHGGFVLKYVGDAIIAFFPLVPDKTLACERALRCAKSMITVIQKGLSPVLEQHSHLELKVKVGLDEGDNVIIQYGHDRSSHIDVLGYSMNKAAKLTSLTPPNTVTIGEDIHDVLPVRLKMVFKEVAFSPEKWRYVNMRTGQIYKLYGADLNNDAADLDT